MTPQQIDLLDKLVHIKQAGLIDDETYTLETTKIKESQYTQPSSTYSDNTNQRLPPLPFILHGLAANYSIIDILSRLETKLLMENPEKVASDYDEIVRSAGRRTNEKYKDLITALTPNAEESSHAENQERKCYRALSILREEEMISAEEMNEILARVLSKYPSPAQN